jgi:hypothetical protein
MGQVLQFPKSTVGDGFYADMEAKARKLLDGASDYDKAVLAIQGLNAFGDQVAFDMLLVEGCHTNLVEAMRGLSESQQKAILAQSTRNTAMAIVLLKAQSIAGNYELALAPRAASAQGGA